LKDKESKRLEIAKEILNIKESPSLNNKAELETKFLKDKEEVKAK